jgi:hypothetical protein
MPTDRERYDLARPFDADELMGGFTEERRQVPVDPDSPLGRAMAEYRERLARGEIEPFDESMIVPIPVEPEG